MEKMAQAITLEMGACIDVSRDERAPNGLGHIRGIIDALRNQGQTCDTASLLPVAAMGNIEAWQKI
jgi:hypothetical protein